MLPKIFEFWGVNIARIEEKYSPSLFEIYARLYFLLGEVGIANY